MKKFLWLFITLLLYRCDVLPSEEKNDNNDSNMSEDLKKGKAIQLSPSHARMMDEIAAKLELSISERDIIMDLFMRDHDAIEPMHKLIMSLHSRTLAKYIAQKWILKTESEEKMAELKKEQEKQLADKQAELDLLNLNLAEVQAALAALEESSAAEKLRLESEKADLETRIAALEVEKSELSGQLVASQNTAAALLSQTEFLLGLKDGEGRPLSSVHVATVETNDAQSSVILLEDKSVALRVIASYSNGSGSSLREVTHLVRWELQKAATGSTFEQSEIADYIFTGKNASSIAVPNEVANRVTVKLQFGESSDFTASAGIQIRKSFNLTHEFFITDLFGSKVDSLAAGRLGIMKVLASAYDDKSNLLGRFDVTAEAAFTTATTEKLQFYPNDIFRRGLVKGLASGNHAVLATLTGTPATVSGVVKIDEAEPVAYYFERGDEYNFPEDLECFYEPSAAYGGYQWGTALRFVGSEVKPGFKLLYTDCRRVDYTFEVSYPSAGPVVIVGSGEEAKLLISTAGEDQKIEVTLNSSQPAVTILNDYIFSAVSKELTSFVLSEDYNDNPYYNIEVPCYEYFDGDSQVKDSNGDQPQEQLEFRRSKTFHSWKVWNGCLVEHVAVDENGLVGLSLAMTTDAGPVPDSFGKFGSAESASTFTLEMDRQVIEGPFTLTASYNFSGECSSLDAACGNSAVGEASIEDIAFDAPQPFQLGIGGKAPARCNSPSMGFSEDAYIEVYRSSTLYFHYSLDESRLVSRDPFEIDCVRNSIDPDRISFDVLSGDAVIENDDISYVVITLNSEEARVNFSYEDPSTGVTLNRMLVFWKTRPPFEVQGGNGIPDQAVFHEVGTGKIWTRGRLPTLSTDWFSADAYCKNLDHVGIRQWRLPTLDELLAASSNGIYLFSSDFSYLGGYFLESDNANLGKHSFGFWTSTERQGFPNVAYTVMTVRSQISYLSKQVPASRPVICVK